MKILLISNMYPNEKYPSYGVFVKNFEEMIKEKNVEIKKVVLFKEKNNIKKLLMYLYFYFKIIFKCIFNDYDLVYVHYISHSALPLLIAHKIKKFKIFINVHGSDVVPEKQSQVKFQKYVDKIMKVSTKVIVPSKYFKGIVSEKYNLKKEKIIISPSGGVNKECFYYIENKQGIKERYNIPQNCIVVGYVGRIDIGKGWDIYLRAINILKEKGELDDKIFIIIGSGREKELLNQMIREYNLQDNIISYGLLSQVELNNIYNILDIFCFPTIRRGESLGLVGLEAMMCGVPVIGSNIGALPEYIKDNESGLLFDIGNHKDLAKKINIISNNLKENKSVKKRYKENCIAIAEKYESTLVGEDLYNELITYKRS